MQLVATQKYIKPSYLTLFKYMSSVKAPSRRCRAARVEAISFIYLFLYFKYFLRVPIIYILYSTQEKLPLFKTYIYK